MGKTFKELEFTDDFMFCTVMQDRDICKGVLELILDIKIKDINYPEPQKYIKGPYESKGIRLDIFADDEEGTVYDVEMQAQPKKNLPRRSRYYTGMIDRKLLKAGADYCLLKNCVIIFICLEDMFGEGRHKYTFENLCLEDTRLRLDDGVRKVFINADGDHKDANDKMQAFLNYLITHKADQEDELTGRIAEAVEIARMDAELEEEYMYLEDYGRDKREEGITEGMAQGRKEGIAEGMAQGQRNLIETMLRKGKKPEEIADLCDYPIELIKEIETGIMTKTNG